MYLNLAAYLFTDLEDLPALRQDVHRAADALAIRGTVLLAPEGINLFVCGLEEPARAFAAHLKGIERLEPLAFKESWSDRQSFNRLLVKLKREIITFRQPALKPARGRAPTVDARSLARWLDQGCDDEGRPVVMVDTRNAFEIRVGSFSGAVDPALNSFTELPQAIEARRAELAGKRLVTYCTGGIRCEKAAILMREAGLDHVWQLDGGILKYFETAGGAHFRGHCFVFDERALLDAGLAPANGD